MAYLLATASSINDPATLEQYVKRVVPLIHKMGGSVLAVEESPDVKDGKWHAVRTVLLSFPTAADANRFYHSPEYQEILPMRLKSTVGALVLLRGLEEVAGAAGGKAE